VTFSYLNTSVSTGQKWGNGVKRPDGLSLSCFPWWRSMDWKCWFELIELAYVRADYSRKISPISTWQAASGAAALLEKLNPNVQSAQLKKSR